MSLRLSKSYIRKMQGLSKDKMILYTMEKASWRNCWLLFRSGKKIVNEVKEVIGYREYAAGQRTQYWYTQSGYWYNSRDRKIISLQKQGLFNDLPLNHTGLEIKID